MPLIRSTPPSPAKDSRPSLDAVRDDLRSDDPGIRRRAVRSLGHVAEVVPILIAALDSEGEPAVREAIFSALMAIPDAAPALASLLRSQDAGLRNGATEALQAMPGSVRPLLPGLLGDRDADVRILSVQVTRCLPASETTILLCDLLESESDPNVCTAAVEILAEIGTAEAVPTLRRLAERFPSEPIVPFSVTVAIKRVAGVGN
jgi:HEAT repeat protein